MSRRILADMRWRTERFDEIDSTNRYLLERALNGEPPGLVAVASYQTAGRGRLDRSWHAAPGEALMFSVLLPAQRADVATRALALAVSDACPFSTALKWPNDVLVDDRKLAGILAETTTVGSKLTALVVGCGMNVRRAPVERATYVDEWSTEPADMEVLLDEILSSLSGWLDRPGEVAATFRERCVTIGQYVRVETYHGVIEGEATEVSDDGSLVVESGGRQRLLTMGHAVHLRAASTPTITEER